MRDLEKLVARIIARLRAEIADIDDAIQKLLALQHESPLDQIEREHKRGRKTMSAEERARVSKRMRQYWDQRKGKS